MRDRAGVKKAFVVPPGIPETTCTAPSCGGTVYWVTNRRGQRRPVNPDGTSHFVTCPALERVRSQRSGA
jgi:hypothetical protein